MGWQLGNPRSPRVSTHRRRKSWIRCAESSTLRSAKGELPRHPIWLGRLRGTVRNRGSTTPLPCCANHRVMLRKPPHHAAPITTSCCAQSQHPERPLERSKPGVPGFRDYARNDKVERSEPEVPGFRDYARNDEVEDPTLCGECRDVTLPAPPALPAHPLPCCANHHVMLRAQRASYFQDGRR